MIQLIDRVVVSDVDSRPLVPAERVGDRYERSPGDVLRLALWTVATISLVGLLETAARSTTGVDADVAGWVDTIPDGGRQLARIVIMIASALAVVMVTSVLVARRRWRRLITLGGTAVLAAVCFVAIGRLTGLTDQAVVLDEAALPSGWGHGHLPPAGLAAAVAVATVARPWSTLDARRASRWALLATCAFFVLASSVSGVQLLLVVACANTAATAVLVVVGTPNRRPTKRDVAAALRRAGLDTVELTTLRATAGTAQLFRATTFDGGTSFVKVYGRDRRDADRLYQLARSVMVRGHADPDLSERQRAEHEALVLHEARRAGLEVAQLRALEPVDGRAVALATTELDGRSLDELDVAELDDQLLAAVWRSVAALHRAGLAHRALHASNILITQEGPAFVGLSSAEVGADEQLRSVDRAQLLASMSALVCAPAAVGAAAGVLTADELAATMPYLQPLALSPTTRRNLGRSELDDLRRRVAAAAQHEVAPLVRLARVTPKSLLTLVALAGVFYLLLPQLANVDDSIAALRSAQWGWLLLATALSALTYVFAAISLLGAVPAPLPFGRVVQLQLATSFVNRVTPANVGGMALGVRFMQRAGVPAARAVTAVGLNVLAGAVVHVGLLAVFLTWAQRRPGGSFRLPGSSTLLVVIVVVLALVGAAAATRRGRRLLGTRALRFGRESLTSLTTIVRSPGRVAALFGGSLGLTLTYGAAFGCAVQAFGGGVGLPEVGAVYLGAAAVAAVAPTPGGLGAMEAALVAGLTGADMDPSLALAAVLTYRLATFWLPILPGWAAFHRLQRHHHL